MAAREAVDAQGGRDVGKKTRARPGILAWASCAGPATARDGRGFARRSSSTISDGGRQGGPEMSFARKKTCWAGCFYGNLSRDRDTVLLGLPQGC